MHDDRDRALRAVAAVLARHWPGAAVTRLDAVPGDASSRRYLRCEIAPVGSSAPASVVVMLNEGSGAALSSDELGVFGKGGPAELPFLNVQRYLAALTDAVPAVYGWTERYAEVVLEDVGDVSLWAASELTDPESLFGQALDLLAGIQTRAADDGSGCYAFRQAFDQRLFDWEFEHFLEYGIVEGSRGIEDCRRELQRVSRRLAALPRVLTHRDYHAWNLHVQDGRIRIIDFQDALLGPSMYDVASLLTDRITPSRITPAIARRLVARFAAQVPAHALGEDDPHTSFGLCAIQRILKVIGRFNYLAEVKGKPRYATLLPAIVPTARALVAGVPELAATAAILERDVKEGSRCER